MAWGEDVGGRTRDAEGKMKVLWDSVIPDREGRRGGIR